MKYYKPEQIIDKIPEAQTVFLPEDWFENLNDNVSVYESLYKWMLETRRVPADINHDLHNRTYVSLTIAKRLRSAEKKRISARNKLRSEQLEQAVSWSDADSGPHTEFAGRSISGDIILVVPTQADQKLQSLKGRMLEKDRKVHNDKISSFASGGNFSQWLFANTERNDPIGDLARDAVRDKDFPITDSYNEVEEYLGAYSSAVLEALDSAWQAYAEKYPERLLSSKGLMNV